MIIKQQIEDALTKAFGPQNLEVINESYKHAGHGPHDGKGETHFQIVISANILSGSRLQKHQQIISALGPVMKQIHALEIKII